MTMQNRPPIRARRTTFLLYAAAALLSAAAVQTVGCRGSSVPVGETALANLRANVAAYEKAPSEAQAAAVEVAFAELDTEIAKLQAEATTASGESKQATSDRAKQLATERYELRNRYAKAIVAAKVDSAGETVKSLGAAMGRGLQAAGKSLEGAATDAKEKPPAD